MVGAGAGGALGEEALLRQLDPGEQEGNRELAVEVLQVVDDVQAVLAARSDEVHIVDDAEPRLTAEHAVEREGGETVRADRSGGLPGDGVAVEPADLLVQR